MISVAPSRLTSTGAPAIATEVISRVSTVPDTAADCTRGDRSARDPVAVAVTLTSDGRSFVSYFHGRSADIERDVHNAAAAQSAILTTCFFIVMNFPFLWFNLPDILFRS